MGGRTAGQVSVTERSHSVESPRASTGVRMVLAMHKELLAYKDRVTEAARYRAPNAKLPPGGRLDFRNFAAFLSEAQNRV